MQTFVGVAGGYSASNSLQVAVTADGRVVEDGNFQLGAGGVRINAPIVGAGTCAPICNGYWLVGADGGVFSFDQGFYGSMAGHQLNTRIVAMAATPDGNSYGRVGADGGVFAFGDARFYGSLGQVHLNAPIVSIVPGGNGYWVIGADEGTFAFGGVPFTGSFVASVASLRLQAIGALPDSRRPLQEVASGCAWWHRTATFSASQWFIHRGSARDHETIGRALLVARWTAG